MSEQIGFVILGGKKIFVRVKDGETSRWVSQRDLLTARAPVPCSKSSGTEEGERLVRIERALKKIAGAQRNLVNGRMVAL